MLATASSLNQAINNFLPVYRRDRLLNWWSQTCWEYLVSPDLSRERNRFLPRLPFQLVSLRSSVIGELLSPRLWESSPDPPEPVLEMDIRDLEGLMADGASDLTGSFLERWWSTLIIASFSMIWAWRFFILSQREEERTLTGNCVRDVTCCKRTGRWIFQLQSKGDANVTGDSRKYFTQEEYGLSCS